MAGLGTRLRPHTWSKPKPLLQVAGKTVLAHLLESFNTLPDPANIELIFIIGYLGDQVPQYMAQNFPHIKAHYITQPEMKGQSQAIHLAREFLHGPVMVVFADTLAETDFSLIGKEDVDGYAWVKSVPDPRRFGVAEVNDAGYITRLIEKPTEMDNNRVVIGLYYYRQGKKLLAAIEEQIETGKSFKGEYFLTDATTIMLQRGAKMRTVEVGAWLDAGTSEALLETNRLLLDKQTHNLPPVKFGPDVIIIHPVSIPEDVKLARCTIGPHVSIANGCTIEDSRLEDCIMDESTTVRHSVLSHSLVGRHVLVDGVHGTVDLGDNSCVVCKKP
ncbi:MAG: nucleotidyltransferase [Anaerolinea sp.]|nr:nucleotidyltransferase [Anaerolinea sp.]